MRRDDNLRQDVIYGRNAVLEAVKSGRQAENLYVLKDGAGGSVKKIISLAREQKIPVKEADRQKLDKMCEGGLHQGVALTVPAHAYAGLDDVFEAAAGKGEDPFIVICDGIEDPHNLGAIIRTAEAAGVHGVIVPKRRSAGLSPVVAKTASGALEYVPVVRVTNIAGTIEELKARNVWIYGADMDGEDYRKLDYSGAAAIVIGSEGHGISRLVREKCDFIVSLPMKGRINSLNASVAAGILMYAVSGTRG